MTGRGPTDQELALRDRSVRDFYGRSAFHRNRLLRAGFGKHGVRHVEDLRRLPPFLLDDVTDVTDLLLAGSGAGRDRRQYWPLQWMLSGDLPLAYSAEDLALLGDLGRDLLEAAGLGPTDVLANVALTDASRDQLQIQLGAQVAGVSAASFGTGAMIEQVLSISPTVLAGEVRELNRLLDAAFHDDVSMLAGIHTFLVVGALPAPRVWKKFTDHVAETQATIVRAWAPPGVFAMWSQCRGGEAFHTWLDVELIEIVDPLTGLPVPEGTTGNIVWTGLEWYATAMLRLQTEAHASRFDQPCTNCGRTTSRLFVEQKAGGFPAVLDSNANVAKWFAELQRTQDDDELVIWIALREPDHSLEVFAEVDAKIGPARVQVVDVAEFERRLEHANGERFGDRRALRNN
jgi:phenylacetate-CoA ligase